jgi:hypothetical protein
MVLGDERPHLAALLEAVAHLHLADALHQLRDQLVGRVSDREQHRDRHAALAGRAVRRADRRVRRKLHVRVGQHNHVVLRAAERLHALARLGAVFVDVLRDRRRADEADRGDVGVLEDAVHRHLVAVDDVVDALRQPGLLEQLRDQVRRRRVALGRLQHEAVAARDRDRVHPTSAPSPGS